LGTSRPSRPWRFTPNANPARASALLLVLMVLVMLTAAVFAFVTLVSANLERANEESRGLEAKAMAHSGLAIGLHPLVTEKTPGLEEELDAERGYRVRIVGEGGRLNINWLLQGILQNEANSPQRDILIHWLELHGLDFKERERLIDCLLDWVDGDDLKRLNGKEDEDDYHPSNKPFQSLDEMEGVAGMEPLMRSPSWKDELTIYSQGPIDLSAADEATLRLLPGMSEARIARFLQIRRGPDGVDGTKDDYQFKTLKEIQSNLGFSDAQFQSIASLVTPKDQTMRIISEGHSANTVRQVEVVATKGGANPVIRFWKE
jgi:general secretion pathway protein K